jgi:tetratricopeptide (TPR) repeat protein
MTSEQWSRVKEVFHAALLQEASGRSAFVAEATVDDELVRSEVERLLEADSRTGDFIEQPAAATFLSGRIIGHYEIGRLLGSGGMGRVYAARDTELGREVALKVASLQSPDAQARLRREAQHASRLSHPNICHIYDVGRADGQLFVVMELVDGRPLADVMREGPLSAAGAARYGSEIADALAHAHERGLMHRDLKSTNVMITARGAKVLDFGLARIIDTHQIDVLSHSQRSLTGEGMIAGTLPYMAPELLRGDRGDQRADIWALGVLLYEMVGGRRPFTGVTGFELSAAILHQPPETLPSTVPAPLAAIIERCLAKAPGDRYQQAAEVHLALEAMKSPAARLAPLRIPAVTRRLRVGVPLLIVILAIAAYAAYRISSRIEDTVFSNARGYSLLEAGEFERAIEEFQGVTDRQSTEANPWDSLGEGYLASGMPDKALDAYGRALTIEPGFEPSLLGRGLALAALGRYDEALDKPSPDSKVQAFHLSRVGRYREAAGLLEKSREESTQDDDAEAIAGALVTASWLSLERTEYARARTELRAAETVLTKMGRDRHALLVFADLLGGVIEIRAGNVNDAVSRLEAQKARYDSNDAIESKWVAALEGEVALAQGQYDRATSSFTAADRRAWLTLGHDYAMFAINHPSRDGLARVDIARGNRAAAIAEYTRLTVAGPGGRTAVLEPRHVLALARLLNEAGDAAGARVEYGRFLRLWAKADEGLPEIGEARRGVAAPRPGS